MSYFFKNKVHKPLHDELPSVAVEGQAMSLNELVSRFTRGERLKVELHESNMYDMNPETGEYVDPRIKDEDFENVQPQLEDRVDIEDYLDSLKSHHKELLNQHNRIKAKALKQKQTSTFASQKAKVDGNSLSNNAEAEEE